MKGWSQKTKEFFATELATLVHRHVEKTIYPVAARQDAMADVIRDLRAQVDELEAKLDALEQRTTLRRIA